MYILKTLLSIKINEDKLLKNHDYHNYDTRNASMFSIDKHRTSAYEKSPLYAGIKLFNSLPGSTRSLPLKEFKSKVKSFLTDKCFYSVSEFFDYRV
ncbi:hypothetical protein C0J52_26503 [Blattella germanica]|nr:hypothetical protein C0J52_26503 [Blattella germanica]